MGIQLKSNYRKLIRVVRFNNNEIQRITNEWLYWLQKLKSPESKKLPGCSTRGVVEPHPHYCKQDLNLLPTLEIFFGANNNNWYFDIKQTLWHEIHQFC
jgi:hypothetical protein